MAGIDVTKVEQHPNRRFVYGVHAQSPEGRVEFPIPAQDEGTAARNELAVLRSKLRFAEDLADSLRLRLDCETQN